MILSTVNLVLTTHSESFTDGRLLLVTEQVGQHDAIMKLQNYLTRRMSVRHYILQFSRHINSDIT